MLVHVFRAGDKADERPDDTTDIAKLVEELKSFAHCRRRHRTYGAFGGLTQKNLCGGATLFVVSELVVPPHPEGRKPKVTHTLAHREKEEPDTVFITITATEDYYRDVDQAAAGWGENQKAIQKQINAMKPRTTLRWEDLPQSGQARLRGSNLAPEQCWIWKPLRHLKRKMAKDRIHHVAPYRDFYSQVVGPIPAKVVLRHKCDNRMCMNPNHLEPGTVQDNVKDMVSRGRHALQIAARDRERNLG
jgi:HNH endonuclease